MAAFRELPKWWQWTGYLAAGVNRVRWKQGKLKLGYECNLLFELGERYLNRS